MKNILVASVFCLALMGFSVQSQAQEEVSDQGAVSAAEADAACEEESLKYPWGLSPCKVREIEEKAQEKENTPEGQARQIEILKERMEKQKKIEIISK